MDNFKLALPEDFLLDITNLAGSSDAVCLKTIRHYQGYLEYPDSIVQQISKAMVGNLTEYYNISHQGSFQFETALPHLSDVANFMDSKNSPNMDVQSTARIKSFYSAYEKLLSSCSENLEQDQPIPNNGFAKDLIATRDILYPRYQLRNDPQAFYKRVYGTILEFMEYIDKLSKENPEYGFEPVSVEKQKALMKPKKYHFPDGEIVTIPEKDFLSYALSAKGIPEVYRNLVTISTKLDTEIISKDILKLQAKSVNNIYDLPTIQILQNEIKKEALVDFRNNLEQEFIDSMPADSSMLKDYTTRSKEDFLYIHKLGIKPLYKDYLEIISNIDTALEDGKTPTYLASHLVGGITTKKAIEEKLSLSEFEQKSKLKNIIDELSTLNLNNFELDLATAKKLQYFASCSKDYMRHPKETGYQSFHIVVRTPFGRYEKQFRTQDQHHFAEYGHASHSNSYKPYEKENFHRLKVCTPLMPRRDENKDIILPIRLEPLGLEEAIKEYYHKDFSFFSGGLSMAQFQAAHPDNFDEAMLALSQPNEKLLERIYKGFNFLQKIKTKILLKPNDYPYDNR